MATTQKTTRFRDYSKGKIYKIIAPDTDDVYIGSTIQTLARRLSKHTSDARRWRSGKTTHYYWSEMMLRNEGYKIELLYDYPCNSLAELNREEGETAKLFPTRVNKKSVAGRTRKEWFQDNHTRQVEYKREWRQNNPEKVKVSNKKNYAEWAKKNPEKVKENNDKRNQKKKEEREVAKQLKQDIKFKEDLEDHELENEII